MGRLRLLALVVVGGLLFVGTAYAHAAYARSEPGTGAVVSSAPTQVEIWFKQDLFRRQGENWIQVIGPDGVAAHSGDAQIDDDDRRHLTVALVANLAPGDYLVTWHTLSSEDGDEDESTFTFTFDPQAQVTSTPMAADADITTTSTPVPLATSVPSPTSAPVGGVGSDTNWVIMVVGVVVGSLLLLLGFFLFQRRKP